MDDSKKLQVAVFPWLGFGHIIPFLQFAEKIAQKGHKVFFISTPRNIKRLPKIPESLRPLINLVQIPLPHVENLPENAEATMDIPNFLIPQLKKAQDGLEEEITHFLQSQSPDWIVYDIIHHWLPPIATKLGVSTALLIACTVSSVSFFEPTKPNPLDFSSSRTELEHFTVPPKWIPFPSKLFFRPYEANKHIPVFEDNEFRFRSAVKGCKVCLVRSCPLIEEEWLNLFQRLHEKPVVPVGFLLPSEQPSNEESDKSWENISEWLDKQKKETLIYVALGSELNLSQQDLNELALGLELSGLPFFWALRMQNCSVKLPDGFEERTKGRGVVWTSWVPQLRVLAHESIGAFLTHCGWGSILEGLQFGRPLVMLPYFGDQPLNARIFDNKIGVEIPRNEQDGSFTKEAVAELVRLVLVGKEGKLFRDEAKKISVKVGDVTLNDGYIDECVKYLEMMK